MNERSPGRSPGLDRVGRARAAHGLDARDPSPAGTTTARDAPGDELPRERLARLGAGALSTAELLALVLRTGTRTSDALAIARAALASGDGVEGLARADVAALARTAGLGPVKAASLVAALELGRRAASRPLRRGALLRGPEDVHRHFAPLLRDVLRERFAVLLLDGRHRVLGDVTVSVGTLTASLVHPREVFRPAISHAAAAIVLAHNHPSGDPAPSPEDRRVTQRLVEAGEVLGIRVVDHVVVSESGYFSFQQAGEIGEEA